MGRVAVWEPCPENNRKPWKDLVREPDYELPRTSCCATPEVSSGSSWTCEAEAFLMAGRA